MIKYLVINFDSKSKKDETIDKLISLGYCFTYRYMSGVKRLQGVENTKKIKELLVPSNYSSIYLGNYPCMNEWELLPNQLLYEDYDFHLTNLDLFLREYVNYELPKYKKNYCKNS